MRDIYSSPESELDSASGDDFSSQEILNPWFSIWTKPRATIQQIVNSNPEHMVLLLTAISGFSQVLDRAVGRSLGDRFEMSYIFIIAIIGGPIFGIIGLYVGSALIKWTGSWMGGNASAQNIRAAMAWSSVPTIWILVLWIPQLLLFGQELFTTETPRMDENLWMLLVFIVFTIIEVTVAIWAIVVFLKCLAQVQGFNAWLALGNALVAAAIVMIPIIILVLGIVMSIG